VRPYSAKSWKACLCDLKMKDKVSYISDYSQSRIESTMCCLFKNFELFYTKEKTRIPTIGRRVVVV